MSQRQGKLLTRVVRPPPPGIAEKPFPALGLKLEEEETVDEHLVRARVVCEVLLATATVLAGGT